MTASHSTDTIREDGEYQTAEVVEVGEDSPDLGPFGALFGGLDIGAMVGDIAAELVDPDAVTLDDLAAHLEVIDSKLDHLMNGLAALIEAAPAPLRKKLEWQPLAPQ